MEDREAIKKYLAYSVCFHLIVFILFVVFGRIVPPPPKEGTEVVMIRLSRSVGSQASPLLKKTGAEGSPPAVVQKPTQPPPQPPPQPATPPAPVTPPKVVKPTVAPPKKPDVITVKKTPAVKPPTPVVPPTAPAKPPETKGPDEEKIAAALAQVKGELEQREVAQTQTAAAEPGAPGTPGQGSPYGSTGGTVSASDPALARYQGQVRSKIIREWIRTNSGTEGDPLRSRVVVRINASGNVISTSFAKRSGNASFDMSAIRAIERASPLPPPPEIVMAEALNEGFVVDFSSRMLGR